MSDLVHPRLRVKHIKDERISYLGHLEMLETIQRSIRRSNLPFAVSQGFAKHMKIQFSQAIPVGTSSLGEYFDVFLTQAVDTNMALHMLTQSTPEALAPITCEYVDNKLPALEFWLNKSKWSLLFKGKGINASHLEEAARRMYACGSFTYMRGEKEKIAHVSKTFVSLNAKMIEDGACEISLETQSSPEGALRPQVFIDALIRNYPELVPAYVVLRVCRESQWHEDLDGLVS